ncbi:transcriptional regulator [Metarhizobium album]|uniref:Transcriptional regulator n=1 Tax=Metarhizobium album TaxID=2182425 RepID=A0A2U2DFG2_9HYPH|nr:helix-turn-helix transcriptional regulator [Rhizobium album]PWE52057.1 transcriptional regulator [Rhizobium album]
MAKSKWDKHSILAELRRRGMTLTRLAEIRGVSPGGFRTIWSRPNQASEAAIAEFIGVAVEELFPDRYPKKTTTILSHEYAAESTDSQRAA